MRQEKQPLTHGKHREKCCSSAGCAPDKVVVENNFLLSLLTPPPPVAGQTTPQTEANAAIAQKLDAAVKEFGEQQVKQCLSGGECPLAAQVAMTAIAAMMGTGESGPSHTGNNSGKIDTGPNHTGNTDAVNVGPNHTGNESQINTGPNHTGGDQSVEQLPNNTGNTEGAPDLPNYMESQGYDPRLPIPEATTASNGLKVESNTKHTPGAQGFRPNAGIEPKNSLDLFGNSVSIDGNKARYSMGDDGSIHRYFPDNTGTYHWSGSTGDSKNPMQLDNKTKAQLRKQEGWKIK